MEGRRRTRSGRPHRASLLAIAGLALVFGAASSADARPKPPRSEAVERAILAQETRAGDAAAKEWREAISGGVAWSYRATSRRIQGEREASAAAANRARDAAIARLEARGAAKAEDLLELAGLHEDRARAAPRAQDRAAGLSPSIALYRRYLLDFPALADRAPALAALARDLDVTGDAAGAIAARRALVCPGLPADPSDWYPAGCRALTAPTALIGGAGGASATPTGQPRPSSSIAPRPPTAARSGSTTYRRAPRRCSGSRACLTARDRPDASARQLVELLRFLELQEKLTGDAPAYLRAPAFEAFAFT